MDDKLDNLERFSGLMGGSGASALREMIYAYNASYGNRVTERKFLLTIMGLVNYATRDELKEVYKTVEPQGKVAELIIKRLYKLEDYDWVEANAPCGSKYKRKAFRKSHNPDGGTLFN